MPVRDDVGLFEDAGSATTRRRYLVGLCALDDLSTLTRERRVLRGLDPGFSQKSAQQLSEPFLVSVTRSPFS